MHSHKCPECGTIWRHDFDRIDPRRRSEAHDCPAEGCNSHQFWRYDGGDEALYCHDGVTTTLRDNVVDGRLLEEA